MIYFVQAGYNGPVKIGQTDKLHDRIVSLQVACPYELKILWVYNGRDFSEAGLHELFKFDHIRGEWFYPSDDIMGFKEKYPDDCYPITNMALARCREDMENLYLHRKYDEIIDE